MTSRGPGHARLLGLLVGILVLGGCALTRSAPSAPAITGARVLVVARVTSGQNAAVGERAAELLAAVLRQSAVVLGANDFLRTAPIVDALHMLARVQRGGWPTPDESERLLRPSGLSTLLVVEVTTYDQVWGKYAKFTRVGVDVEPFHVLAGARGARLHGDAEVEDKRGRAFEYAIEQAIGNVAAAMNQGTGFSPVDVWRFWRR